MTKPKKTKSETAFLRLTYEKYGYKFTRVVIYNAPSIEPIEELIGNCDKPDWYQSPDIAARMKRSYTAMRDAGVESVVDTVYSTRVELNWQHIKPDLEFGRAAIELRTRPGDLDADYRFYRSLVPKLARVEKYHQFERPDVVLRTLETMGAREMLTYRSDPDWTDRVFYKPGVTPTVEEPKG
jgi:hypothetical protein